MRLVLSTTSMRTPSPALSSAATRGVASKDERQHAEPGAAVLDHGGDGDDRAGGASSRRPPRPWPGRPATPPATSASSLCTKSAARRVVTALKPCASVIEISAASSRGSTPTRNVARRRARPARERSSVEALLEVGCGGGGDAQRRRARAALAGRVDDGGSEREHFRLALSVGEQLVDEQLRALRGTGEMRLALASREAVEREIGAPRQREDEARAAEASAEQEAALERRSGASGATELCCVGD